MCLPCICRHCPVPTVTSSRNVSEICTGFTWGHERNTKNLCSPWLISLSIWQKKSAVEKIPIPLIFPKLYETQEVFTLRSSQIDSNNLKEDQNLKQNMYITEQSRGRNTKTPSLVLRRVADQKKRREKKVKTSRWI
jgi:hypothetical protein